MNYGICNLSLVPVRADASERSEMVTQVLFGEHFEILNRKQAWCRIRLACDRYEGWIDEKMYLPLDEQQCNLHDMHKPFITSEIFSIVYQESKETPVFIMAGSSLPFFDKKDKSFRIGDRLWHYYGEIPKLPVAKREKITKIALNFQNAPYLWGGRSPAGIDCSGFTQLLFKICGIPVPRDASGQVGAGKTLSFLNEAQPGDLAFFDDDEGNIIHVGMVLGDGKIIHASGKVRVDILDHQGIYNADTKRYTHKLRVIQNILD
ncbi:MAG: C40 family peptidase [Bacteroidetes bacterium]|nr:C40 family peptidase [Bacteroidota bacterium]